MWGSVATSPRRPLGLADALKRDELALALAARGYSRISSTKRFCDRTLAALTNDRSARAVFVPCLPDHLAQSSQANGEFEHGFQSLLRPG